MSKQVVNLIVREGATNQEGGICVKCKCRTYWYRTMDRKEVKICYHDNAQGIQCEYSGKPITETVPLPDTWLEEALIEIEIAADRADACGRQSADPGEHGEGHREAIKIIRKHAGLPTLLRDQEMSDPK